MNHKCWRHQIFQIGHLRPWWPSGAAALDPRNGNSRWSCLPSAAPPPPWQRCRNGCAAWAGWKNAWQGNLWNLNLSWSDVSHASTEAIFGGKQHISSPLCLSNLKPKSQNPVVPHLQSAMFRFCFVRPRDTLVYHQILCTDSNVSKRSQVAKRFHIRL